MEDQASAATASPSLPSAVSPPTTAASAPAPTPNPAPAVAVAPSPSLEPVSPAAVREDQVRNAVEFLSHPQVRSSTNTASKRSFLERKGLTPADIDEAFRRVPEASLPAAPAPVAPPTASPAPQPAHAPAPQPIAPQAAQAYAPGANPTGAQLVAAQPPAPAGALVPQVVQGYRWSQIVLGVGAVFAAGWAVHQLVLPRLRSLVDSWQSQRREADEARQKELQVAVESLKGCQEELKVSTQALLQAVNLMREQQRTSTFDGALPTRGAAAGRPAGGPNRDSYYANVNGRGDHSYGGSGGSGSHPLGADNYPALRAGAGYTNAYPPDPPSYTVSYSYGRGESGPATAGPTGGDGSRCGTGMYGMPNPPYGIVRSATANPYGGPGSGGPGQQQQQQENLPYRVTAPPSPAHSTHSLQSGRQPQPPAGGLSGASGPYGSSDRLYDHSMSGPGLSGPKPAMSTPGGGGSSNPGASSSGASPSADGRTVPRPPPEQPVYPQSFHEVMEMVQQGITPPNVRTDINDTPPDPTRPFSEPRIPAPPKPWERAAGGAGGGGGSSSGSAGLPASNSTPYGALLAAGRPNVMPYSWGSSGQADQPPMSGSSVLPAPPPTAYGAPSSVQVGSAAAGASGSAGSSAIGFGGSGGVTSNSAGAGSSSSSLSFLPPANPAWRPPPPPARTITSTNSASSLPSSASGAAGGGGEAAAAAPAATLTAVVPEPGAALAGPPSPPPSQPALAASAPELTRPLSEGPSAGSAGAAGSFAAASPPPPLPAPHAHVRVEAAEGPGDVSPAVEVTTPSASPAPATTTP